MKLEEMKPEVQALVRRGNVTSADVKTMQCNSWEWHALHMAMTDEALAEVVGRSIANASKSRTTECATTYDEDAIHFLLSEVTRRLLAVKDHPTRKNMEEAMLLEAAPGTEVQVTRDAADETLYNFQVTPSAGFFDVVLRTAAIAIETENQRRARWPNRLRELVDIADRAVKEVSSAMLIAFTETDEKRVQQAVHAVESKVSGAAQARRHATMGVRRWMELDVEAVYVKREPVGE